VKSDMMCIDSLKIYRTDECDEMNRMRMMIIDENREIGEET